MRKSLKEFLMKRLIAILSVCFLLMFLAGCGNTEKVEETVIEDTATESMSDLKTDIYGTWATVVEESADEDVVSINDIVSITFKEDGTYVEDRYASQDDLNNGNAETTIEGTFTIDGDDITFTVNNVNDKTEDELKADPGDFTDTEIDELFETTTFSAALDVNLLVLENDHQTIELSRYE